MALKGKQARFKDEYLVDLNAKEAAIRAGYSKKTAEQIGYQLLHKTSVQEAIAEAMKKREVRTAITQDRVLKERARLAFYDPRNLFHDDGSPKAITDLDDDTAAAIAGLEVVNIGNETHGIGQVLKYKLIDKSASLTALEKHLGMYEADNKQKNQEWTEENESRLAYLLRKARGA